MAIIYGIDTDQPVTAILVRDALVRCFAQAHCPFNEPEKLPEHFDTLYAKPIVEKAFIDSGGDFEHPTKESLMRAVIKLMDFSKIFTDPSVIEQHAQEMRQLIEKIK